MRQLLYTSSTNRDLSDEAIASILLTSRRNNAVNNITGILIYIDGGFMQVLEGDPQAVADTFARISIDRRHWNTEVLLDRTAERAFGEWSMGFTQPNEDELAAGTFALTREAVAGRLKSTVAPEIIVLLRGFYRIQHGSDYG